MDYLNLPKIDLHCHLDGSVRPQTVIELAIQQNITLPSDDLAEVQSLMVAPDSCLNLDEYLTRFELPLSVMQTTQGLERIAFEVFEDAAHENVKYLEVRFAPLLHLKSGLTLDEVISSVVKGMKKAQAQFDIQGNIILSIIRNMPKDRVDEVIDAGAKYIHQGVVAFDLAGSEVAGFCEGFIPHAKYAAAKGYRVTIHAGEQGVGQNVYDAISMLGAERIGHGIDIKTHRPAYVLTKKQSVALESCPTSNVQTKAVSSLEQHPFNEFYKQGVLITINTDNRTVSNTTMTNEVRKMMQEFNLSRKEYFDIYKASVANAFASDVVKRQLLALAE